MYPSDRQMYPWGYMYPRLGTAGVVENDLNCHIAMRIFLGCRQKKLLLRKWTTAKVISSYCIFSTVLNRMLYYWSKS